MKRRQFLAASCTAGVLPWAASARAADDKAKGPQKELYELRLYQVEPGPKQRLLSDFLREAALPAWRRMGIGPVGVFTMQEPEGPAVYVLLPHKSPQSLLWANARLMSDAEFLKVAAAFLDVPMSDPAFKRIESTLLLAFDNMPRLQVPTSKPSRVLQLRIYESHGPKTARKKIEMFNEGGEIEIFRRVGMTAVFFGEALVGPNLPNLTYMLGFDDAEALKTAWDKFKADPEWLKLKADPQYKDTVSKVTNILLRPAPFSQI
jgi:hypothetical protein